MKYVLILLLITLQLNVYGQSDTTLKRRALDVRQISYDCAHGHLCCEVGCPCCPGGGISAIAFNKIFQPITIDSLKTIDSIEYGSDYQRNVPDYSKTIYTSNYSVTNNQIIIDSLKTIDSIDNSSLSFQRTGPDYSKTIYPKGDSLTYDQFVGETIAGYTLADGWRQDSINGGYNKQVYVNPYINDIQFDKSYYGGFENLFRYENGKLYTGVIADTITASFTPDEIVGYLSGMPYYETKRLTVIFRANCVNGILQGRAVLCGKLHGNGYYDNILLAECNFENGEIVGACKAYDLNSTDFWVYDGRIKLSDDFLDCSEIRVLLDMNETTYKKGSSQPTEYATYKRNKRTGELKEKSRKTLPKQKMKRLSIRKKHKPRWL